jgi:6-phosphogluconate dehydrogenase
LYVLSGCTLLQKGTGKWTGIAALDMGTPLTLIAESVFARCVSALKSERVEASKGIQVTEIMHSSE